MSQEERTGLRNRSYSVWHRRNSMQRFVGIERAQTLAMIDLDGSLYVEYDNGSKEPLMLVETAVDTGQTTKSATVTRNLARLAHLPAFIVLYRLGGTAISGGAGGLVQDIDSFRVKKIWPAPETEWKTQTPEEWAKQLVKLREWSARRVDKKIQGAGYFFEEAMAELTCPHCGHSHGFAAKVVDVY